MEFQFALGHEPEHHPDELENLHKAQKKFMETGTDPIKKALFSTGTNTIKIQTSDKACMPMPPPVKPKTAEKGVSTEKQESSSTEIQTENNKNPVVSQEIQTEDGWIEIEVQKRLELERAEQIKKLEKSGDLETAEAPEKTLVDKTTETEDDEFGEFIVITCTKCEKSTISDDHEEFQKIQIHDDSDPISQSESIGDRESGFSNSSTDLEEFERIEKAIHEEVHGESPEPDLNMPPEPLIRHSMPPDPDYSDVDSASLDTVSINTVINVEPMKTEKKSPLVKTIDPSKIEALRKLLTEPRQNFSRDSGAYRSVKLPKAKTTEDLEYIANKHAEKNETTESLAALDSSMPSEGSTAGLTDVVTLKKALPTSPIPEPIPAKIPRPKVSKYSMPMEQAVTPDEEAEAAD